MLPLNYAILDHMTRVAEADAAGVMAALRADYGGFGAFTEEAVLEALLTAEANGLLEESRCDLDGRGRVRLFFRATARGRAVSGRNIGA